MLTAGVTDAGGQFTAGKDTGHKPELVDMYLSEYLNINPRSHDLSLTLGRPLSTVKFSFLYNTDG
jgi:hypothetical protein